MFGSLDRTSSWQRFHGERSTAASLLILSSLDTILSPLVRIIFIICFIIERKWLVDFPIKIAKSGIFKT